jgi:glyoxylase-like metal-dependent hydrolase (beta-lactamase superfamily II)
MEEVLPGVLHWTTFHEGIGQPIHSHFYVEGAALFDPRVPEEGIEDVARHGRPETILLSNRHHLRHAEAFAEAFDDCPIKAQRAGLHEFAGDGPDVHPFDFGETVAPGVTALEVGALTAEDTAFHIAAGPGVLLFADAVIRDATGALSYVPDSLMGDDPATVRHELTAALRRLLERDDFDALLFAHGAPQARNGRQLLQAFVAEQERATGE